MRPEKKEKLILKKREEISLIKPMNIEFNGFNFNKSEVWAGCKYLVLKKYNGNNKPSSEKRLYMPHCHYDEMNGVTNPYCHVRECKLLQLSHSSNGSLPLFFIVNHFNIGLIPCEKMKISFRGIFGVCLSIGHNTDIRKLKDKEELFCSRCGKVLGTKEKEVPNVF